MKKLLNILFIVLALCTFSCKKNFEPNLSGLLSTSIFPKTAEEFELYALSAYKPFGAKWGYSEVDYQNMFFSPEYGHLVMFDLTSDQFAYFPEWGGLWEGFSKGDFTFLKQQGKGSHFEKVRLVTKTTQILADLEKTTVLSDEKKKQLMAEVRMARGWMMFYLLHMYGPLPVILDPAKINTAAEADLTRPKRNDFVSAIASDLRFAADNLPTNPTDYGRFNKGVALGVLMRLHLNEKDFVNAEKVGREILPLGYSLVSDYAGLFREATKKNNETIWAVTCDKSANGDNLKGNFNIWGRYCYPADMKGISMPSGWASPAGAFTPTWAFYDSFDSTDKRRLLMIPSYTSTNGQLKTRINMRGPVLRKYPDESGGPDFQGNDIPVLRYADVLLMLAEAINQNSGPTSEAIGYINQVRNRSALNNLPAVDVATKDALNDAILRERGWELYFEGVRKMDLVRFGKWPSALSGISGKQPGPNYLLPVPQYALDLNGGLTQTPGY